MYDTFTLIMPKLILAQTKSGARMRKARGNGYETVGSYVTLKTYLVSRHSRILKTRKGQWSVVVLNIKHSNLAH